MDMDMAMETGRQIYPSITAVILALTSSSGRSGSSARSSPQLIGVVSSIKPKLHADAKVVDLSQACKLCNTLCLELQTSILAKA